MFTYIEYRAIMWIFCLGCLWWEMLAFLMKSLNLDFAILANLRTFWDLRSYMWLSEEITEGLFSEETSEKQGQIISICHPYLSNIASARVTWCSFLSGSIHLFKNTLRCNSYVQWLEYTSFRISMLSEITSEIKEKKKKKKKNGWYNYSDIIIVWRKLLK